MNQLPGVLQTVIPVLIMLCLGMIAKKYQVIDQNAIVGLKSLVVNITLPAVLFGAFLNATYTIDIVVVGITMFACCLLALICGFFLKKLVGSSSKLLPYLMSGFEAGMLGYALFTLLFGAHNVSYFAMVDLGQVLFVFTVYMSLLNAQDGKGGGIKRALRSMATSPVILSIVSGVLLGATSMGALLASNPYGNIVSQTASFICAPTAVVILLVVGFELDLNQIAWRQTALTLLLRVLLMAVLCVGTLLILKLFIAVTPIMMWSVILMFTLPPPFVLPVFVDDPSQTNYISSTLSASTLLCILLFIPLTYFVGSIV